MLRKLSDLQPQSLKNGRIFSVKFVKKDGSIRSMIARTGVKKHLKGGELKYSPEANNKLIVWSFDSKGYRTINTDSLVYVKHNGVEYGF